MGVQFPPQTSKKSDLSIGVNLHCSISFPFVLPNLWDLCHTKVSNAFIQIFLQGNNFKKNYSYNGILSVFFCFQDAFEWGKA